MAPQEMKRRGLLIILSSPSGAGKSTLARRLMDWDDTLSFSVSATTRAPRPGEVDGQHYHFLDEARSRPWWPRARCWNTPMSSAISTARPWRR
jgi:guanylate kinase